MLRERILLVEDDKAESKVTGNFLEQIGYEVIHAENGKTAIKQATADSVDLIILDLVLPDIGGNEVCRWLKTNENTRNIPVIMLTARSSTDQKVAGLEAGADDYIPKPYDKNELKARIYACLRTKALQDQLREKNNQLEEVLLVLEKLAITDALTELNNRRHFESVLEIEFDRAKRYKFSTSCLMIDIDHFKAVNDKHGHRVGDQVLKEMANLIKHSFRKVDIVARWGGEEFVVLLCQTDKEEAVKAAARLLTNVSSFKYSSLSEQITVSIGISGVPDPDINSSEKMIDTADNALYKAKANGRNRIEVS